MASGIISLGTKSNLRGQIVWSSVSNGSAANTSTVTAELQARKTSNTTIATEGNWTGSLNIGGTSKSFTKLKGVNSNAWVTLYTFSITVAHDSTGAGTCYIYGKIKGPTGTSLAGYSVSGSETVTLDNIPRFATITSAPNFNDEENPTISYSNPAGTTVTSLSACISLDGTNVVVADKSLEKSTSGSYTFSLDAEEREALLKATTKNSRTVYFVIRTVIGGNTGEIKYPVTFSVKDPAPKITPTIQDNNEKTKDLTGDSKKLVRYFSNAQITIGAEAQKESTITSQKVTNGNKSLTADGVIQAVESGIFNFTATDSRGNTTTKSVKPAFVSYIKPTCLLANNIPDAEGAMTVKATGNYFNGSFGAKSNSLTVRYRYKVSGGSYGEWAEMTVALSSNTYTATAALTGLDYQTAYVFQTEAKDELTTVYSAEKTVKATPVFDWGEKDFQFHVPVKTEKNVDIRPTTETSFAGLRTFRKKSAEDAFSYMAQFGIATTPGACVYLYRTPDDGSSSTLLNQMILAETYTSLRQPLNIASGGHGAKTAIGALDNLGALNLGFITDDAHMIASGDDLNTYTTPGAYRCANASVAATLKNSIPRTDSGFRLIVTAQSSTAGIVQIAIVNTKYTDIYIRTMTTTDTWGEWVRLCHSGDSGMHLLWPNANPTGSFGAATLSIDGADYDCYMIVSHVSINTDVCFCPVTIAYKGKYGHLIGFPNNKVARRRFFVNSAGTSITFENTEYGGTYGATTANNEYVIPMHIYGMYLN